MTDWNLNYLGTFAAVAEFGSITLAAKKLSIAQPAVSRQMRLLEEQVGVPLMRRDHEGVRLTPAGQTLREHIVPWLKDLQSIRSALLGDEGFGTIRFGSLTEAGQSFFMAKILRFAVENRNVDLEIIYDKEFELRERLEKGELDAMIGVSSSKKAGFTASLFMQERSVIVSRSSFAVKVDSAVDIKFCPFVTYRKEDPLLKAYLSKFYPQIAIEEVNARIAVNSHRSMIDAILATNAVALMPWHSVEQLVTSQNLRIASKRELVGNLHLTSSSAFAESSLGQTFLNALVH